MPAIDAGHPRRPRCVRSLATEDQCFLSDAYPTERVPWMAGSNPGSSPRDGHDAFTTPTLLSPRAAPLLTSRLRIVHRRRLARFAEARLAGFSSPAKTIILKMPALAQAFAKSVLWFSLPLTDRHSLAFRLAASARIGGGARPLARGPPPGPERLESSMIETARPVSEGLPLDRGLRALCGIAAYYRIGADPVQLARELALGAREAGEADLVRAARLIGLKARLVAKVTAERLATLPAPAIVRVNGALMVFGGRNPVGALPARRSDQPRGAGSAARGRRALDRRTGASDRAPDRRRRRRPAPVRHALVPADDLALSPPARPCSGRVAVCADFRPHDAALLPGRRRQGADPSRLRDPVRAGRRARHHRPVRRGASIFAHLCAFPHHQPDRRRARPAPVRASFAPADRLFRDPVGRADGRAGARARDDPQLPHRTGPVLGDRSRIRLRVCRRAHRLFVVADPDRARRDPVLCADRVFGPAPVARPRQGEIQSRRGEPAIPGRDHRRRQHGQGGRGRADHARAMGGEARGLCQDELRRRDAGLGRPARDPVCQQGDHRGALAVRRQGRDRRRAHRRRSRRLQHDRVPGGGADPAPVPDLAGFPAGADLDRALGRHPQRSPGILAVHAPSAADAARRDRIPPRLLSLSLRARRRRSRTFRSACGRARRSAWSVRRARANRL